MRKYEIIIVVGLMIVGIILPSFVLGYEADGVDLEEMTIFPFIPEPGDIVEFTLSLESRNTPVHSIHIYADMDAWGGFTEPYCLDKSFTGSDIIVRGNIYTLETYITTSSGEELTVKAFASDVDGHTLYSNTIDYHMDYTPPVITNNDNDDSSSSNSNNDITDWDSVNTLLGLVFVMLIVVATVAITYLVASKRKAQPPTPPQYQQPPPQPPQG